MKSLEQLQEDLKAMEAELAAKERRIAELEAVASDVTSLLETTDEASDPSTDTYVAVTIANAALSDKQPPFEGLTESIEPVLDPDRVLATAVLYFRDYAPDYDAAWDIQARMPKAAKPYKLKGAGDE